MFLSKELFEIDLDSDQLYLAMEPLAKFDNSQMTLALVLTYYLELDDSNFEDPTEKFLAAIDVATAYLYYFNADKVNENKH